MALLDWFPEIHLRLSMHYCPNGAFPFAGSGWELAHTDEYLPAFTLFCQNALFFIPFIIDSSIASHLAV